MATSAVEMGAHYVGNQVESTRGKAPVPSVTTLLLKSATTWAHSGLPFVLLPTDDCHHPGIARRGPSTGCLPSGTSRVVV